MTLNYSGMQLQTDLTPPPPATVRSRDGMKTEAEIRKRIEFHLHQLKQFYVSLNNPPFSNGLHWLELCIEHHSSKVASLKWAVGDPDVQIYRCNECKLWHDCSQCGGLGFNYGLETSTIPRQFIRVEIARKTE